MGGARVRGTCCLGSPWAGNVSAAGKQQWAGRGREAHVVGGRRGQVL